MQSTSSNPFKVQATEKPSNALSSSDRSPSYEQPTQSRISPPLEQRKIPSGQSKIASRNFVEEDEEETIIPVTAVRKHLDHSQPRVSSYPRTSTSIPNTLSKAQSMDAVRQHNQYVIQDHYSIDPLGQQQNSVASSPTPRKRRVSGESSKSIQSTSSNTSVFGAGGSINRIPQMMKSSLGSVKQFVSRSASISTSSRSRFSLRPGDKSSNSRELNGVSSGSSLESVQEQQSSPQPSFSSLSTPTQRGSKISRFRHRTSSIIDLSNIFTKPNPRQPSVNEEASYGQSNISSPDVSLTDRDRHGRAVPKIIITNQQQNDTQKVQDPRQCTTDHPLQPSPPHPHNENYAKQIDEYHSFTDKPGGVGTILFGKEIANINIEDISSDVDPTTRKTRALNENVYDTSQVIIIFRFCVVSVRLKH
jgi:hypothetical protein